jgi:tryptophan synthase beta chain
MVARFQSIISEELLFQLKEVEGREYPDFILACVGGGSNAAGIYYHYLDNKNVNLVGVEAAGLGIESKKSAATTKLGKKGILHGSKTLLMQDENGQVTEPYSISAGLDYPGIGPLHAHLFESKRGKYISVEDDEAMKAGIELSRLEGIIPAIETAHAFAVFDRIDIKNKVVVVNLSGRGDKDLDTYIKWGNY